MPQSKNRLWEELCNMKLNVSTQTAFKEKPHIQKGYYHARLKNVKPLEKEGKYGKMMVMEFEILKEGLLDENKEHYVLGMVTYYEYKRDDGTYVTAATPKSRLTKTLKALGVTVDLTKEDFELDTKDLLGREVEVLVKDYVKEHNGDYTVSSSVEEVNHYDASQTKITEEDLQQDPLTQSSE